MDSDKDMYCGRCNPFLNWVGSKRRFALQISEYIPPLNDIRRYYEPFVGGGSIFFSLYLDRAWLSDVNEELIKTYMVVQKLPAQLLELLKTLQEQHSEEFYYHIRDNTPQSPLIMSSEINVAARFIYLNRASFNSLYRVNKAGKFNVPVGRDASGELKTVYSEEVAILITEASRVLRHRCEKIGVHDYREAVETAGYGDFIYLDPPYYGHRDYTAAGFNEDNHVELADIFNKLIHKGVRAMITNADTPEVRELYKGNEIIELSVRHNVSGKSSGRKKVKELLIRNYK